MAVKKSPDKQSIIPAWGWGLFWMVLSTVGINLLSLAVPVYFMQVYDRILPSQGHDSMVWITLAVCAALVLEGILNYFRNSLSAHYSALYALNSERRLLQRIGSMGPREFLKQDYSGYERRFRSITEVENFYRGQLFQSILDFPFIVLFLGGIYFYSGKLVYFHLGVLALMIPLYAVIGLFLRRGNYSVFSANGRRYRFLAEVMDRIHFLKSQALEEMLLRRAEGLQDRYSQETMAQNELAQLPIVISSVFSMVMVYGTILLGGILIIEGNLSVGLVTASTMLARRAIGPFQNVSRFFMRLSQVKENLELQRLEVAEPMDGLPLENQTLEGYVEFRSVSYPCENSNCSDMENMVFQANRGSVNAFTGDLAEQMEILRDLLLGFRKPSNGEVVIDNLKVSQLKGCYLSRQLVYLPRKGQLYNGSILDNISRFDQSLQIQALEAAALVGLDPIIARFPRGYETQVKNRQSGSLTPAIIQRISLARAFVDRPRILVSYYADDAMDQATLQVFMKLLKKNQRSCTSLLITRRKSILDLADNVFEIDQNRLKLTESRRSDHG